MHAHMRMHTHTHTHTHTGPEHETRPDYFIARPPAHNNNRKREREIV